jgi:tripartite-type tricarboxylate transporter receptor subunit TctC
MSFDSALRAGSGRGVFRISAFSPRPERGRQAAVEGHDARLDRSEPAELTRRRQTNNDAAMPTRRAFVAAFGALALTPGAHAAEYPERLIRVVVPRAPGGGSDIIARVLGPGMQERMRQGWIVENKPDASAVIGAQLVARAAPDGYTVLLADNAFYQNPAIIKDLSYDTLKDFAAVTLLAQAPVLLLVDPSVEARDLRQLIDYAKANPGKLAYGSGGIGSSTHLAGILFNRAAGIDLQHVPYRSAGAALDSQLGGHIAVNFGGISSSRPHVDSGKLRALAITGRERHPAMPAVPTFAEAGLPGVDIMSIWGIHAPAATPLPVRRALRDHLVAVMRAPELAGRMAGLGFDIVGLEPAAHEAETRRLVGFWLDMGRQIKLGID